MLKVEHRVQIGSDNTLWRNAKNFAFWLKKTLFWAKHVAENTDVSSNFLLNQPLIYTTYKGSNNEVI